MENCVQNIIEHLGDDLSRTVFASRIGYNLTRDSRYIGELRQTIPEVKSLISIPYGPAYIFGCGNYGTVTQTSIKMDWQGYSDNDSQKWGV